MNWLNIELSTLRSEFYLGSDPVQRATWLNLMAYCADQENSGKICGCGEWGSRRWLQLLGITKEEVRAESCLWKWIGEDVVVWSYPKAKEAEVRAKREAGKKGGRPLKIKDEKPDGYDVLKPSGLTELPTEQKRKGKEGKGMEEEIENNTPPAPRSGGASEEDVKWSLELSRKLRDEVEIKAGQKLTSKAESSSFLKLLRRGISKDQIEKAVDFVIEHYGEEYFPVINGSCSFLKKWDNVVAAKKRLGKADIKQLTEADYVL